jgi:hypothetical protein
MNYSFLFFPFTHITDESLEIIMAFFPVIKFLSLNRDFDGEQRLSSQTEQGRLVPVHCSKEQLAGAEAVFRQYLEWAQIHRGNERNLKVLLKDNPYFTSDSDIFAIKSQLRGSGSKKQDSFSDSSMMRHILFLKTAHCCDEQNEKIDRELLAIAAKENTIVRELRGVSGQAHTSAAPGYTRDPGEMMAGRRIHAWSACMAACGELNMPGKTPVFVTTSRSVFDYLDSICTDSINALDIDSINVHEHECENSRHWQAEFIRYLVSAVDRQGNPETAMPHIADNCKSSGFIKVKRFSGEKIETAFNLSGHGVIVCLAGLRP